MLQSQSAESFKTSYTQSSSPSLISLKDLCTKCDPFVQTSSGKYELVGAVSWGRNCAKSFGVYADLPCRLHLTQFHYQTSISISSITRLPFQTVPLQDFHFNQLHYKTSISIKSIPSSHNSVKEQAELILSPYQTTVNGWWTMWAQSTLPEEHQLKSF